MLLKIKLGLFKFDFTDQHAILGVTVDATSEEIRNRYKYLARLLHPDSCKAESLGKKERSVELFSQLVNPAYVQLYKERNRAEYEVILRHMRKQLAVATTKHSLASAIAKQLARAGPNLDNEYSSLVQTLAANQYEDLDKVIEAIAQLSELNMVYLIRKEQQPDLKPALTNKPTSGTTTCDPPPAPQRSQAGAWEREGGAWEREEKGGASANELISEGGASANELSYNDLPPDEKKSISQVEASMRRAAGYIMKSNFPKAVLELRDALALEPNNSSCHSLLGMVYLKQNLMTMAKVHINKALQLNPQDARALQGKQILDQQAQKAGGGKTTTPPPSTPGKSNSQKQAIDKPSHQSGGGLFGGLFGGKKKEEKSH